MPCHAMEFYASLLALSIPFSLHFKTIFCMRITFFHSKSSGMSGNVVLLFLFGMYPKKVLFPLLTWIIKFYSKQLQIWAIHLFITKVMSLKLNHRLMITALSKIHRSVQNFQKNVCFCHFLFIAFEIWVKILITFYFSEVQQKGEMS